MTALTAIGPLGGRLHSGAFEKQHRRVLARWALLAAGLIAFIVLTAAQPRSSLLIVPLSLTSAVTCGFAWLFARSLFRSEQELRELWPRAIVGALFVFVVAGLYFPFPGSGEAASRALLGSLVTLTSSAVLLFTLLEPVRGLDQASAIGERRFRLSFLLVYGAILAFGVVAVETLQSFDPDWRGADSIYLACAGLALTGATLAAGYRLRTLAGQALDHEKAIRSDRDLAEKIASLLADERLYREPDLKVSDLAQHTGMPEHRVSRAITQTLGHANFNRMVNEYRLQDAAARLRSEQAQDTSILGIAMDAGFASLGPFNRAFKERFGMTPSAYRREAQAS